VAGQAGKGGAAVAARRRAPDRLPVWSGRVTGAGGLHPALRTSLCDLVGIDYPIVQTGMGWVAGPGLTAATSEAGGLGILAAATMSVDDLRDALAAVKDRTPKPFGVNLRADQDDVVERIDLLIREQVKVASFAMAPREPLIRRLREAGVLVMPSVGARRHAEKVAAWGVDAVLVQGGEGGGHTGQVPTSLLLPQVVDTVDIPVVAAGGFFDGRGLVAALAYGAVGIAMGTRFLLTSDSSVPDPVKQAYLSRTVTDTLVTTQVDGVPHRVLRTPLVESLEHSGPVVGTARALANAVRFQQLSHQPWPALVREGWAMHHDQELTLRQVVMAANAPMLLKAAMVDGRPDLGVMASGQVVGLIDDLPSCAELIGRIMGEADRTLRRLTGTGPASGAAAAGAAAPGRPGAPLA
jgi:NAD(P)H-dependent flavin oxidoreductase YrpB (nitropropane dioxygenase family)